MKKRLDQGVRGGLGLAVALAAACSVTTGTAQAERERPLIVIPRLAQPPVIDGVHAPGEWDRAVALTGFVAATGPHGGVMAPQESIIYLGHDGERLYMAVWCALPPGVKPSMNYRRRNEPVYMDRYQMELWLTPPVRGGQLTAYQMIGNAYGAIYDVKQIPQLGAVTTGWNGNWTFENSYETGQYWTAELSIPFADFGETEVNPDEYWGGMVGVAWPQRSWPFTFGWYKNVDTHARMFMAEDGTCVRVESLDALLDNRLDARLAVVNDGPAGDFSVLVRVDDVERRQTITVPAGETADVTVQADLPEFAAGVRSKNARIEVTAPDGRTLLSGNWPFRPIPRAERVEDPREPEPWALRTRVQFAPEALGLRVWADLLDYPGREAVETVRFTVRSSADDAAVLTETVTNFDYDAAETYLWLPDDLPFGAYAVETAFMAADGSIPESKTDTFNHRDLTEEFAWIGNDLGTRTTVAPPFEPVRVEGHTVAVWGREMTFEAPLPGQVISRGEALLSGPVTLTAVVDGRPVPLQAVSPATLTDATDERVLLTGGRYAGAGLTLTIEGRVEFDGMIYYTLEQADGDAPELDGLYLSVPVKTDRARYYHSTAGGWSGSFGIIEPGTPGQQLWSSDSIADFTPYVGISDDARSIQWFADNDHDWILGDEQPCSELLYTADGVELRVHFVRRSGPVSGLRAEFGLIATPVKPMPAGWRHTSLDNQSHGSQIPFFYGAGHGGCPVDPHDTKKLADVLGVELDGRHPDAVLSEAPAGSIPLPDRDALRGKVGDFAHYAHQWAGGETTVRRCWFFNAMMYFEGNRSAAFRTFFPGEWQLDPPSGWFHLTATESFQDFFAFYMNIWMKHWIMPGLYFDEVYLPMDYNVFNGNGRVMADGTVRPGMALMRQRRFMNRMRQLFLDHGRESFIWVHSSNFMAPYAISATDVAMFGEDRTPTATMDMYDAIPAALIRAIGGGDKFGFIPLWMVQAGRGGDPTRHVGRQTYGWVWMHDAVPEYHTSTRGWPLVKLRQGWGIEDDSVRFVPYWDNADYVTVDDPNILVSLWVRPDVNDGAPSVHALVTNLNPPESGITEAHVTFHPEAFGAAGPFTVYDMESQPELVQWEADWQEAERLREADATANQARIREITRNRDIRAAIAYDKALWTELGQAATVTIPVAPRDFRAILAE